VALLAPIAARNAQNATRTRISIKPDHAALWREPFDAIVITAIGIRKRALGIEESAGAPIAHCRKNPVEGLHIGAVSARPVWHLRSARRAEPTHGRGSQKRNKDSAP
jgi:hypothetical protein